MISSPRRRRDAAILTTVVRARLAVLTAAVLFSTGGAAIKACTLTSWQIAGLRSGFAALTLLVLLPEARRRWQLRSVAVGGAYAATMVTFVLANKLTTAANAIFLQSTAPLYILLLAPWLLGEALRPRDATVAAVFALGLLLIVRGAAPPAATAPDPTTGDAIAMASGLGWALTLLGLRWLRTRTGASSGASGPALVCGNLLAFAVCLPMAPALGSVAAVDWLVLGYLGVVQIGLAYLCLNAGVRHVRALDVSLLLLLEPVLSPLWAWGLHDERPGAWSLVGGAVILLATAMVATRRPLLAAYARGTPAPGRRSASRRRLR